MKNLIEQGAIALTETSGRTEFPLVESWVDDTRDILEVRSQISSLLTAGKTDEIINMGFPRDLVPVMLLWKDRGPDILTSFSHPEEMDLYKIIALFNLRLFQMRVREEEVEFPRILINYYDTVEPKLSTTKPFQLGSFGSDYDLFGLRTYYFNDSSRELKARYIKTVPEIARKLIDQLGGNIGAEVKLLGSELNNINQRTIRKTIENLVISRLDELANCFPDFEHGFRDSQALMDFQRKLAGAIFSTPDFLENIFGYECALFSQNQSYINLIKDSLKLIIESRGTDILKQIIEPGNGLALVKDRGARQMLTKNSNGQFCLKIPGSLGEGQILEDADKVREIVCETGLSLAKLETLAIIAGGFTFHMGSEYGIRNVVLDALDIKNSQAYSYLSLLRISQDKEAGNEGILLQGNKNHIPLALAYVMFGKKGVRKLVEEKVGKTSERNILDVKGLKRISAQQLVSEVLEVSPKI